MPPKTRFDLALDQLLAAPRPEAVARAQTALRRRLQAEQPPAVWYDLVPDTPVGPLWVAVSEAGLAAIHYGADARAWLAALRRRGFGAARRSAEKTARWRADVAAYLLGRKRSLPARVDWRGVTNFQRRVLEAAAHIPRGHVQTYQGLARELGRPQAARAVGQALRRNPVPIVLPCHRVVAADGDLRGYLGQHGVQTKAWLLHLEGARL